MGGFGVIKLLAKNHWNVSNTEEVGLIKQKKESHKSKLNLYSGRVYCKRYNTTMYWPFIYTLAISHMAGQ